jgi:hypothetical protein
VLAAGFSVLLGLIVFLAFTSYDDSRSGAEAEALAVSQRFETARSRTRSDATLLRPGPSPGTSPVFSR